MKDFDCRSNSQSRKNSKLIRGFLLITSFIFFSIVFLQSDVEAKKNFDSLDPNISTGVDTATQMTIPLPGFKPFVLMVGKLSKPIKSNPDDGSFWLERANKLMAFGLYQEAVKDLKEAQSYLKDEDITVTIKLAQCYFSLQDYDQTLWLARKVLSKNKDSAEGHAIRALGLIEYPDRALEECNRAIELDDSKAWFYLARARVNQGNNRNWTQSISDCNEVLKRDPKNLEAMLYLAKAYLHRNKLEKVVGLCNKILMEEPMFFEAYKVRASAYEKDGQGSLASADRYLYKNCLKRMKDIVKENQS